MNNTFRISNDVGLHFGGEYHFPFALSYICIEVGGDPIRPKIKTRLPS
jgi:hypothetical protein